MSGMLPASGEYYRIANVEYATFLEVSRAYDGASVSLRPKKLWVERQQWAFVPGSMKNTYMIKSVASIAEPPSLYLFADMETGVVSVTDAEDLATQWKIPFRKNTKDCTIMFQDPKAPRKHKFLYVSDCQLDISASQDTSFSASDIADVYKWNLVNVWHSLPKDNYRIRSIGGQAIYITTDKAIAVDTLQAPSSQTWALEPKPNGKCELKNANSKAYITTTRSKDGYEIIKVDDEATVWQLRCVGEFAFSLSVRVDYFTFPLALTISEMNNGVTLKPLKDARNQIWFFEPADVKAVDPVPAPPPYEGQRYSEITNGGYNIYNTARSPYRYLGNRSGPWRWIPFDSSDAQNTAAIRLSWVSTDSASFYLAVETKRDAYAAPSPHSSTLAVDTTPHRWILEREDDPAGGYRYYIRSVTTQKVLSSDSVIDINEYPVLRCDTKILGNPAQMWKFQRVTN